MGNLKDRATKVIENLNQGIHEREEVIAILFLAALSNQNIFLLGPPGTAKSLIARRFPHAFETDSYFQYLMHRFSTPEEVFGPVSITELKKDNFLRKTEGFLPQSDFAFLDEIWKSSPAILNTLLTIINEKLFRNGTEEKRVPLKALIAASNETPPPDEGLDALYDRFLVRLNVSPMEGTENFERLLNAQPTGAELELPDGLAIKNDEWKKWGEDIHSINLSEETLNIIHDIRLSFEEKGEELDVYVSDRRWQKAAILLKAAAFFCDRKETNLVDTLLLRHCLWSTRENYEAVAKIVDDAVRDRGFETDFSLNRIDSEKEELEKEINKEFYLSEDVYETEIIGRKEYFKHIVTSNNFRLPNGRNRQTIYIPKDKLKSADEFHPIDKQGNELGKIMCCFDSQGTCSIKVPTRYHDEWQEIGNFSPKILFHKEAKKTDVNIKLIELLRKEVLELSHKIEEIIEQIKAKLDQLKTELETPFVPERVRKIALEGIEKQLQDMKLRHKDCERLKNLIG